MPEALLAVVLAAVSSAGRISIDLRGSAMLLSWG
jgi:hypothetical protein